MISIDLVEGVRALKFKQLSLNCKSACTDLVKSRYIEHSNFFFMDEMGIIMSIILRCCKD